MQPGVQHWHTGGPSRGAVFNDDHLRYIEDFEEEVDVTGRG